MGYTAKDMKREDFEKGFYKTLSRGPDMSKITETKSGILAFHRLAIMGLTQSGMQPFRMGENYAVCNGELYGFRKMKEALIKKGYRSSPTATAKLFCRFTGNTAPGCSQCSTPSSR
jgi:asparagine synthase (glutamine-hydrolysing)